MESDDAERSDRDSDLPEEVLADLLGDPRRRLLLELLAARDGPMVIDDAAAHVRARETDADPEDVPIEDRRAVSDDIFERHLPKLTAVEVVQYDSLLGTVELADDAVESRVRA